MTNLTKVLLPPEGDERVSRIIPIASCRPGKALLNAWLALPTLLTPQARLAVVMHGVRRNAREYLETWREWSQSTGRPVLAPHFDSETWPRARAYNLGNVLDSQDRRNPRRSWAFTALQHLVSDTRRQLQLADLTWDLFGHSAGAQFVHRFALLRPSSTLGAVVVAGAGWFTVPDPDLDWPYGTRHPGLDIDRTVLTAWTRRPIVLMRGGCDRVRDEHLRTAPEADAQGLTRWDRAAHMLAAGQAYDPRCRWELIDVPAASHSEQDMAPAVQAQWRA